MTEVTAPIIDFLHEIHFPIRLYLYCFAGFFAVLLIYRRLRFPEPFLKSVLLTLFFAVPLNFVSPWIEHNRLKARKAFLEKRRSQTSSEWMDN